MTQEEFDTTNTGPAEASGHVPPPVPMAMPAAASVPPPPPPADPATAQVPAMSPPPPPPPAEPAPATGQTSTVSPPPPPPADPAPPTYEVPAVAAAAAAASADSTQESFAGIPGPAPTPPTGFQVPPAWSDATAVGAAAAPTAPGRDSHRIRNTSLVTGAALVLLAAGVGIGHSAWKGNTAPTSALAPSNSSNARTGTGSGTGSGSGGRIGSGFGSNGSSGGFGGSGSGGGFFGNSGNTGSSGNSGNSGNSGSGSGSSITNNGGPSDVSSIAAKVDPGLVDINTTLGYQSEQAAGTGIVLSSNGIILTNNHVIDGATTISVTDIGNHKTYSASVVGYDRTKDIAVLQLHNASGLTTANLATTSSVSVGEDVVGIGNAGGTGGTPSAAGGTVTALNQSITASDEGDGSSEQLVGLIETNADIQAGDSGGSLVNSAGQVIGIDTAASAGFSFQSSDQSSGTQGFAIPINTALSLMRQIVAGDASSTIHIGETAFLGVEISTSDSSGEGGGFGEGSGGGSSTSGADIAGVVTSSPAQEAGLAQGDVITSLDGQSIGSATDLTNDLTPHHPGDKVTIGWTDSSGDSHTTTVTLTSGPPQ
jgi:S1-C subfamily serine protease